METGKRNQNWAGEAELPPRCNQDFNYMGNSGDGMAFELFYWGKELGLYYFFFQSAVILLIFSFIFISWRLITLQYCSGFCHTLT